MARSKKKPTKRQPLVMQYFIFAIKDWVPSYSLSVNHDKFFRAGVYSEYVGVEFDVECVFPQPLVGRTVNFHLAGDRDCLNPPILKQEPDWKPRCVGALEMFAEGGRFYASVPHESIPTITTALAHGLFRYAETYGPPLKRGKSLCTSFRLLGAVDLDEH